MTKDLRDMKIHIIGIGGTGMSPIAVVLHEMGVRVSGSDRTESSYTAEMKEYGIEVHTPQCAENITDPDLVLYSSAIKDDNPELAEARRRGIPTKKRREFLRDMLMGRKIIAIAGSHGKTTTTCMCAWVFTQLGLEPGYIIGSFSKALGSNAAAGKSDWFIIEADEYDNMFLGLDPTDAVLTKVEYDHPDCFPTRELYFEAFAKFLANLKDDGMIFLNGADVNQEQYRGAKTVTYGSTADCDLRGENLRVTENGCFSFDFRAGDRIVPVTLNVPGEHNACNAMAVLSVCAKNGLDLEKAAEALTTFGGVGRRFERVADWNGITLIDDYAHHPTEIRATLKAAREFFAGRRIVAVWQPHTYSRTQSLLDEFCSSFDNADEVILTDIYAAREKFTGFGIADVVRNMKHENVKQFNTIEEIAAYLAGSLRPGDVVVTCSAGDANKAAPMALEMMKNVRV